MKLGVKIFSPSSIRGNGLSVSEYRIFIERGRMDPSLLKWPITRKTERYTFNKIKDFIFVNYNI
jgi:hypothetical protein